MLPLLLALATAPQDGPRISGIHPAAAVWNDENEAGIGAVVPWAGRLWFLTYAPHRPGPSTDRLWSLVPGEAPVAHAASVGGTHASRLIHGPSQQLCLGPYVIDHEGGVRVLPRDSVPGRFTGAAPSPWAPNERVLIATMEEGLYEVDVRTLAVTTHFADGNAGGDRRADLPGTHGKGLASGHGAVVYTNNGESGPAALRDPRVPSGCLAEWDGSTWTIVRRAQFTEVTGPGGPYGSTPGAPLWAVGWDAKSVLLGTRAADGWSFARLPKGSRTYDGAHGWNTEWPRIRSLGSGGHLMTMHGLFWRFPSNYAADARAGLAPRTSYLKVVADFARYGDWVVLGCDDTARSGFLNDRALHGGIVGPGQSHSNLWFLGPEQLDALGPVLADGAIWEGEDLEAGAVSEPFLVTDLAHRSVFAVQHGPSPVALSLEVDPSGTGTWEEHERRRLEPGVPLFAPLDAPGPWVRVRCHDAARAVTVRFACAAADPRSAAPAPLFDGLARRDDQGALLGGRVRVRGGGFETLALVADRIEDGRSIPTGLHHVDATLTVLPQDDGAADAWHRERLGVPEGLVSIDAASAVVQDHEGQRWRLPLPLEGWSQPPGAPPARIAREVVTERDLLHVAGTFYELPARNAGGFAGLRPIASHPFWVQDFCGYRGLLVLTGLRAEAAPGTHVRRSEDGRGAVWVGAVDDLWQLGRPRGRGGPWLDSPAEAGVPSDPFLVHGLQRRRLTLSHDLREEVSLRLELDPGGTDSWYPYLQQTIAPEEVLTIDLPDALCARWLRAVVDRSCRATAQLEAR